MYEYSDMQLLNDCSAVNCIWDVNVDAGGYQEETHLAVEQFEDEILLC